MNPWDAGWVAGLFEGEGCVVIRRTPDRDHVAVQLLVNMTDEDVIQRLAAVTGVGTVRGPVWSPKRAHKKPVWHWFCGREQDVAFVLVHIFPYLGERRRAKVLEAADVMAMRFVKRQARIAKCGTQSGYNRHRRLGQPYCADCRKAAVEAGRQRKLRKKGVLVLVDDLT